MNFGGEARVGSQIAIGLKVTLGLSPVKHASLLRADLGDIFS
jgi:hypothetical protein